MKPTRRGLHADIARRAVGRQIELGLGMAISHDLCHRTIKRTGARCGVLAKGMSMCLLTECHRPELRRQPVTFHWSAV